MPTIRFFCVICGTALEGSTESTTGVAQCHSCAHHVPVPHLADVPELCAAPVPAFPPEVLAMEVKFLCTSCQSRLGADARWEGRGFVCPVCGDKTRVPRWSRVQHWPRPAESALKAKAKRTADATLSPEEIAFLSQPAPINPASGS